MVAVVKEVAPTTSVKTDEELGVQEFQVTYFNNFPVYLDEEQLFYKYLGSRNVLSQKLDSWNPFKLYSEYKTVSRRLVSQGSFTLNLFSILLKYYVTCQLHHTFTACKMMIFQWTSSQINAVIVHSSSTYFVVDIMA